MVAVAGLWPFVGTTGELLPLSSAGRCFKRAPRLHSNVHSSLRCKNGGVIWGIQLAENELLLLITIYGLSAKRTSNSALALPIRSAYLAVCDANQEQKQNLGRITLLLDI